MTAPVSDTVIAGALSQPIGPMFTAQLCGTRCYAA